MLSEGGAAGEEERTAFLSFAVPKATVQSRIVADSSAMSARNRHRERAGQRSGIGIRRTIRLGSVPDRVYPRLRHVDTINPDALFPRRRGGSRRGRRSRVRAVAGGLRDRGRGLHGRTRSCRAGTVHVARDISRSDSGGRRFALLGCGRVVERSGGRVRLGGGRTGRRLGGRSRFVGRRVAHLKGFDIEWVRVSDFSLERRRN